jgi:hypothetical protein
MQLDTQESATSLLQNVSKLRSPPRPSAPPHLDTDRALTTRRWDVTPPTTATAPDRRQDLQQILTTKPQTNGNTAATPRQPGDPYRQIQPTGPAADPARAPQQPVSNHQSNPHHQHRDSQPINDPPPLEPDENKTISRAAEVRELSTDARCGSCHLAGRRCYIDSANPSHCVSCPTENHCIFRRTVVREGPATHFLWHELVGIHNIPQVMPAHRQQHMMQQPQPHPHTQMQQPQPQSQPQSQGQLPVQPQSQPQPQPRSMEVTVQHSSPQHHPGPSHQGTPHQTPQHQLQGSQTATGASQSQSQGPQSQPAVQPQSQ